MTQTQVQSGFAEVARRLADEDHQYDPGIRRTYWFPDPGEQEIRLIHVDETALDSNDVVEPFYFGAAPKYGINHRSAIALIRPEEDNKLLVLPIAWGSWSRATAWDW